ncbi:MAG: hypothetical protein JWM93_121 [Frankiales bacterium]|nr:hypothetical protein [Frankiales bacterium]
MSAIRASLLTAGALALPLALAPTTAHAAGLSPGTVAAAAPGDFTGDGTADALTLTGGENFTPCTATLVVGDTAGAYAGRTLSSTFPGGVGGCPTLSATGSVNGVEVRALAFYFAGGRLTFLHVSGADLVADLYEDINEASFIRAADLNGDGNTDFYEASDSGGGGFWAFLSHADGTLTADAPGVLAGLDLAIHGTTQEVLTPDGQTDVVLAGPFGSGNFQSVAVYSAGRPLQYVVRHYSTGLFDGTATSVDAGDVNRDGWPDVTVTGVNSDTLATSTFTALQRPDHTFVLAVALSVPAGPVPVTPAPSVSVLVSSDTPRHARVTFYVDGVAAATSPVKRGSAAVELRGVAAGVHTVVAVVSGDRTHSAMSSPPVALVLIAATTHGHSGHLKGLQLRRHATGG